MSNVTLCYVIQRGEEPMRDSQRTQQIKQILYLPLSLFQLRSKNKNIYESKIAKKTRLMFALRVLGNQSVFD